MERSLTGFGSKNIILDESALIEDDLYAMVKRMLGGHRDNFLLEISNPFTRGHFLDTWKSQRYYRLFIDYQEALKEGRYSPDFIEEMRGLPYFDVLYKCKFPDSNRMLDGGWLPMFPDALIENAFITTVPELPKDAEGNPINPRVNKLGGDIGGGGDESAYSRRVEWLEGEGELQQETKFIELLETNQSDDTMYQVGKTQDYMAKFGISAANTYLDDVGIGRGVRDRIKELGVGVNGVNAGQKPADQDRYANVKAENYWEFRMWLENGGKLVFNEKWRQLGTLYYKENSSRKLVIMGKEEMRKRGLRSPDVPESAMLTFSKAEIFTSTSFSFA